MKAKFYKSHNADEICVGFDWFCKKKKKPIETRFFIGRISFEVLTQVRDMDYIFIYYKALLLRIIYLGKHFSQIEIERESFNHKGVKQ